MKKFIASATCAFVALASVSTFVDSSRLPGLGVDIVAAASTTPAPQTQKEPQTKTQTPTTKQSTIDYSSGSAPEKLSRVVKYGNLGHDVRIVQGLLLGQGYSLSVDGSFGKTTLGLVKDFQKKNGLKADGFVGPLTYGKLRGTSSVQVIARTIKYGFRGEDVKLVQNLLNSLGYNLKVDSSYGPKTITAVKDFQKKFGLKVDGNVNGTTFNALKNNAKVVVKIGKAEYEAHGVNSYALATVAMAGDKIAAAYVDEFQFMNPTSTVEGKTFTIKGVPNSDQNFGKNNYKDYTTSVLASKRLNAAYYSENMRVKAKATQTVDQNFGGVEAFAVGKTIAQLEAAIAANKNADGTNKAGATDAVAGATLADTNGYLHTIVLAAKAAQASKGVEVDSAKIGTLKLGKAEYEAHGVNSFALAIAAVVDNKIAATYVDEFQFMNLTSAVETRTYSIKGVPNSDKSFGLNNYKNPTVSVLASKRLNAEYYSDNMKIKAGATQTVDQNFGGVEAFAVGKTVAELEAAITANKDANGANKPAATDAVAGATLADTNGYLHTIVLAAKAAK